MLEDMLKQLPNFAGLVVAILVQAKLIADLSANNRYLTNVIVNRENCEKPEPVAAAPAPAPE